MKTKSWMRLLGAVLVGLTVGRADAQATDCTDDVNAIVPTAAEGRKITKSGYYCLTEDLFDATSMRGITIDTAVSGESVILDLKGYRLHGFDLAGERTGIFASNDSNITVRNGTVSGFRHGVMLAGTIAQGNVVEDLRVVNNNGSGINVGGKGALVRRNLIIETGKSLSDSWGIGVLGDSHRVTDNEIVNMRKCIGCTGRARGIWVNNGAHDVLVVNNHITVADWGVVYDGSTGAIRDNLNSGVASPYVAVNGASWIDAGNNH